MGDARALSFSQRWREGARVPTDATGIFQAFLRVAGSTFAGEDLLPQLAFFMSKSDRVSLLKAHLEDRGGTEDAAGLAKAVAFRSTSTIDSARRLAPDRRRQCPSIELEPRTVSRLLAFLVWSER